MIFWTMKFAWKPIVKLLIQFNRSKSLISVVINFPGHFRSTISFTHSFFGNNNNNNIYRSSISIINILNGVGFTHCKSRWGSVFVEKIVLENTLLLKHFQAYLDIVGISDWNKTRLQNWIWSICKLEQKVEWGNDFKLRIISWFSAYIAVYRPPLL